MLDQDRRDGFKGSSFFLVGHRRFLLGVVKHFQENRDGPPFQIGDRYEPVPRGPVNTLTSLRTVISLASWATSLPVPPV